MTTTVWAAVVALSALVAASPAERAHVTKYPGGPPDTLIVSSRASSFQWKGSGLAGSATREGTLRGAKGMFVVRHQQLTRGILFVDLRQLDVAMRSEAFFDVVRHPTAVFTSTGMTRVGPTRWQVSGTLELRGVTRPITFDADVRWEELGHMVATSRFTIDRRQWGIGTAAGSATNAVADNEIQLSVTLDARRKQSAVATR